jgi:AcrR family transcriptional regulator
MSPRKYAMQLRDEGAAATRERIARATSELHSEKGVAATTFRDIAERADVGIGTVYHHFPSYEHVITACGAYSLGIAAPPQPSLFDGIDDPRQRVRTLVREVIAFYLRIPGFARVRGERKQFAALDAAMRDEEEHRRVLVDTALRPVTRSMRIHVMAFALLDFSVYEALADCGLPQASAVDEITNTLLARIGEEKKRKR